MSKSGAGGFCWFELATPNVHAAKEFYSKMLGWNFSETSVGDTTYTIIHSADDEFGGMWEIPATETKDIPPHWLGYIAVEDLAAKLKEAEQLGATIKVPTTTAGKYGKFAVIVDPTGAHVALWESVE